MKIKEKKTKNDFQWRDYYFVIIPIAITILIYSTSIFFGFRNFDEDNLIRDFYMKKTLGEYIDKFLFLNSGGVSEAHGFTFSSIKNIHVCVFGLPSIYLINYLFQAKPYLYHIWSLSLHCSALFFFIWFCFNFTQNKQIAFFTGLIWSLHPTNVEPIIWATNWLQLLGATFYFFTLNKILSFSDKDSLQLSSTKTFIFFITLIQILFTEHTITIPLAIFFTILYKKKSFGDTLKASLPSFIVIAGYWLVRTGLISQVISNSSQSTSNNLLERVVFFTPQILLHQLKLIFIPLKLTIDQIDLLILDKTFLGPYNIFCIITSITIVCLIFISRKKLPFLSFGILLCLITLSLFIQIIPLYSLSGERYNYLASAFIIFGIISTFHSLNRNKLTIFLLIILSVIFTTRTVFRILDWKDSYSLFSSAIKTSKSLYKKGVWTYNLAICKKDKEINFKLLEQSSTLLKEFIHKSRSSQSEPAIYKSYELDQKSLITKALMRIATNYELLKNTDLQLKYLLKALNNSNPLSQSRSLICKNLGTLNFQFGNYEKAISYYKKSYSISPTPTINFAIAVSYLKLNDFQKYAKYLKESISKNSTDGEAYKAYGQFLEFSKGDHQSALKYYKISSFLLESPEPYILLSTLYLKLKDINKAFETLNKGLYGSPTNPTLLYLHSTVLINKGKIELGLKELMAVAENINTPKDIRIESSIILSNIFLRQNDLQKAETYNDLVLTLDPRNQEALKNNSLLMIR